MANIIHRKWLIELIDSLGDSFSMCQEEGDSIFTSFRNKFFPGDRYGESTWSAINLIMNELLEQNRVTYRWVACNGGHGGRVRCWSKKPNDEVGLVCRYCGRERLEKEDFYRRSTVMCNESGKENERQRNRSWRDVNKDYLVSYHEERRKNTPKSKRGMYPCEILNVFFMKIQGMENKDIADKLSVQRAHISHIITRLAYVQVPIHEDLLMMCKRVNDKNRAKNLGR